MIDIKLLEKDQHLPNSYYADYKKSLEWRGADLTILEQVLQANQERKKAVTEFEGLRAEQNKLSGQVAQLKRSGQDANAVMSQVEEIKIRLKNLEEISNRSDEKTKSLLAVLPNKLHSSVPRGESAEQNVVVKEVGTPRKFPFKAREHFDLGEKLQILDFERSAKVTGARFAFLKGLGARLERAIINFCMDLHSNQHGYTEMIPPYMVNSKSYFGTGQFPKFINEVFHLQNTDYHLISTAEVPVTNYYADEILAESALPTRFAAFSPCFRSEAGAAGKDTRGLIRQHQFHKVELMIFSHPSQSYELHEQLTSHAEQILSQLELPYRRSLLCSGDIGFGAAKCYDLEVWLPGSNMYREISSCSNFEDFQARRAQIRFRPGNSGKPEFVHTINGSGLAIGRSVIAVLENYQREDGSIAIPKVLRPYMNNATEIGLPID